MLVQVCTYPRTEICRSLAALMTSSNRSMLSSIEQLMFFLLKVSDADPNTATSVAPAATLREAGGKKELVKLLRTHRVRTHTYVSAGFIRHRKISVPATDWSWQAWVDCSGDQCVELEMSAYGILEALDVRCQNRILNIRHSLDSSEYVAVVCHLHEGNDKWCLKKEKKALSHPPQRDSQDYKSCHISWYKFLDMSLVFFCSKHCKKTLVQFMTEHEMATYK